jgi:large subunit ribosomal protein L29
MSTASELRDLSLEELKEQCVQKRKELYKLTNEQKHTKQFDKPHRIQFIRKEIARLLTVITQKENA